MSNAARKIVARDHGIVNARGIGQLTVVSNQVGAANVGTLATVSAVLMLMAVSVHAAVPTVITDAIATAETDITTVFGAVIGLSAIVMGFRWIKRSLFS